MLLDVVVVTVVPCVIAFVVIVFAMVISILMSLGVHMLFKGEPAQAWGNDKRINKLVFIGKKLDREELETGLKSCLFVG
jgi:G3E family GTPase